jgi:hypothetical protein
MKELMESRKPRHRSPTHCKPDLSSAAVAHCADPSGNIGPHVRDVARSVVCALLRSGGVLTVCLAENAMRPYPTPMRPLRTDELGLRVL